VWLFLLDLFCNINMYVCLNKCSRLILCTKSFLQSFAQHRPSSPGVYRISRHEDGWMGHSIGARLFLLRTRGRISSGIIGIARPFVRRLVPDTLLWNVHQESQNFIEPTSRLHDGETLYKAYLSLINENLYVLSRQLSRKIIVRAAI
jgi:hypothetical protein